jgi:HEPN domain-containing protein
MGNRFLDWFKQVEADVRHAANALKDGDFEWSCFASQQGRGREEAEKAIECAKEILEFCRHKIS